MYRHNFFTLLIKYQTHIIGKFIFPEFSYFKSDLCNNVQNKCPKTEKEGTHDVWNISTRCLLSIDSKLCKPFQLCIIQTQQIIKEHYVLQDVVESNYQKQRRKQKGTLHPSTLERNLCKITFCNNEQQCFHCYQEYQMTSIGRMVDAPNKGQDQL